METVMCIENNCEKALIGLNNYSLNFKESISSIIKKYGFLKYTIKANAIDTNNGNYFARLYEVDIEGGTDEGNKEIHLFIKESLELDKMSSLNLSELYDKEIFVYTNFANVANKLQDEAKIPEHDRFKFVPAYGGNNEIIILDNLSKHGFKTYYRMDVMPIKYAELTVMELAKFHALSFVIEARMPEYFEKQIKTIEISKNYDDDWNKFITNICVNAADILDGKGGKIASYAPIMKEKIFRYTERGHFKNCLSHGDYRLNNIMVKEMDGVPTEVAVVDYQFVGYGNPMRDLMYLIYTSSDRKFRQKHLDDLKNIYYDTITSFLVYFNLDVNNIYPRDEFERAYTEYREYGLMMGLFLSPFLFISENEKFDISNMSLSEVNLTNLDVRYKERIQGIIEDFIEWGYL